MSTPTRRWLACTALLFGLALPFVAKPVHIDDANFLALARGARLDLWRPHDLPINWQGSTERAFDVLSNPPGIGWWLAPVAQAPELVQHLWMLAWVPLLAVGAWRLGRRFGGDGVAGVLLLGTAPAVLLASQSLTPDLPLLALCVAGMGGFVVAVDEDRTAAAAGWAMLAGCAALFRYSGVALLPLLLLYPLLAKRRPWPALAGLLPLALLLLHDLHAYGEPHLLAMVGFQSASTGAWDLFRKLVAALAMLGAAGVLPLIAVVGGRRALLPGLVGLGLGLGAAHASGLPIGAALWTAACAAAGAVVLAGPLLVPAPRQRRADLLFLLAWSMGGLCFLLALRFTAARYWLPFLPAVALLWLRLVPSRGVLAAAVGLQIVLGLALAVDDLAMARTGRDAAREVHARADQHAVHCEDGAGERVFAGHWGWQHYLERQGWRSLEDEERLRVGALLASSEISWPQQPEPGTCLELVWERSWAAGWPGPRVHTARGYANLHAFLVAGEPPVDSYVPWSFATDPRDHTALYRICEGIR
jgi:hypothetical protein